ncbi:MAG: hypothetical protein ACLPKB_27065, partial [Xanthobacteraceae bacterium]
LMNADYARPNKESVLESAPADGIWLPVRPNGKLGTSRFQGSLDGPYTALALQDKGLIACAVGRGLLSVGPVSA